MSETDIYEQTVDEQLDGLEVYCGTHGVLDNDEISVGLDGVLHCQFCSLNQEMDTRNELDIDSRVRLSFKRTAEQKQV